MAVTSHLASPNEQMHVEEVLNGLRKKPVILVGDRAYDSEPLREKLLKRGITLVAPIRKFKVKTTQDSQLLQHYQHRWKIERTMSWLVHHRRLVNRWEVNHKMYDAFVKIACALITCRYL